MKIWFFVLLISICTSSWAYMPLTPYKVRIHMKDGSLKIGFIEAENPIEDDSKFEPNIFLKECLNYKPNFRKFKLYNAVYSINDDGKIGGIAFMKKEETEVNAEDVKRIDLLKSPHDNDELKGVPVFSEKIINLMQKNLVCCDDIGAGSSWEYIAFNYNPRIEKYKLHRLLVDYKQKIDRTKKPGPYNEILSSENILFVASYSD